MRALGPGSISSFLKMILDVVHVLLWAGLGAVGLITLAAILLSFDADLLHRVAVQTGGPDAARLGPFMAVGLLAFGLSIAGVLTIVRALRQIFETLTAQDPFHPDNVGRLRLIGLMLGLLEVGRYVFWGVSRLAPGVHRSEPTLNLTAWFSVLVVFVLAEVFREGARLRREAELTI